MSKDAFGRRLVCDWKDSLRSTTVGGPNVISSTLYLVFVWLSAGLIAQLWARSAEVLSVIPTLSRRADDY